MIKKIIAIISLIIGINISFALWQWGDETDEIYTQNQDNVINTDNLDDPLRAGTKSTVQNVEGVINAETDTAEQNQNNVIKYISKWLNYFLGLLALIVTLFIIKDGIVIITAASDDNKQKEAIKNVKNYIIALISIGLIYLLVNLIFYFVNINTIT